MIFYVNLESRNIKAKWRITDNDDKDLIEALVRIFDRLGDNIGFESHKQKLDSTRRARK